MLIEGIHYNSITYLPTEKSIRIIDQRFLPFKLIFRNLSTYEETVTAIRDMQVRGAPLIGITAAFGLFLATTNFPEENLQCYLEEVANKILTARPTAVNAEYCVSKVLASTAEYETKLEKRAVALKTALELLEEERQICLKIGENGLGIIQEIADRKGKVNILTHCNAGWLACVDYGTITSPIYLARQKGVDLHVWVDETRPKNQGARLTVWELTQNGVENCLITDNAGGHLMQKGMVDLVLVGCDRVTRDGDVANKIGTYLKALAAYENNIPFYVALPSSTIDWKIEDGLKKIPIENRDDNEVKYVEGWLDKEIKSVLITTENARVYNPGFDVTPAKYITGLITERGICEANCKGLKKLFPEKK